MTKKKINVKNPLYLSNIILYMSYIICYMTNVILYVKIIRVTNNTFTN